MARAGVYRVGPDTGGRGVGDGGGEDAAMRGAADVMMGWQGPCSVRNSHLFSGCVHLFW
jgi:hypothetical protein